MLPPTPDDNSTLRITLFGGLSIRLADQSQIELPPRQSAALLAYLALNCRQPQSREVVFTLLWPEEEPEKARQNLRRCLHYLRDLLEQPPFPPGSILLTTRTSIQLNTEIVSTDVAEFEQTLGLALRSEDRAERIRLRSRAAELYGGELLPGYYQDSFVLEQHRLAERHLETLGLLIADLEAIGDPRKALPYASRAVMLDPLSEEAYCALMRLYAAMGQPAAVQRQYLELEARLRNELGEGPSEQTRLLAKRLQENARRQAALQSENESPLPALSLHVEAPSASESAAALVVPLNNAMPPTTVPARSVLNRWRWLGVPVLAALALLCFFFFQTRHAMPFWGLMSNPGSLRQQTVIAVPGPMRPPRSPSDAHVPSSQGTSAKPESGAPSLNKSPLPAPTGRLPLAETTVEGAEASRGIAIQQHSDRTAPAEAANLPWNVHYDPRPGDAVEAGSEPTAMTVDPSGNVYVTGLVHTLKTDVDFLTLKYSPEGKLLWQQRYNGAGNDLDRAKSIAVDAVGNVYVTGESDGGKGHGPERLNGLDIVTIKYGPDGKPSSNWPDVGFGVGIRRYAGSADGMDSGRKIALDREGNVYVFGQSWGGDPKERGTGADFILIKYSSTGQERWSKRYSGGALGPDAAVAMILDERGNAFLTGRARRSENMTAVTTLKYDREGNLQWEQQYAGPTGTSAAPTCLTLDRSQNIYVIGQESFPNPVDRSFGQAYLVLKYDPMGKPLWQKTHRWRGYGFIQIPTAAAVDGLNCLYVTGKIYSESDCPGCGTLKYASGGELLWSDPYRSAGHAGHFARALGLNSVSEVFVAGWGAFIDPIQPNEDTIEYATLQYDPDGKQRKLHRYTGPDGTQGAFLIAIDRKDNVILSGQARVGKSAQITTIKYHP